MSNFFSMNRTNCERCGSPTHGMTIMSWFTEEVICMDCSHKEDTIKKELRLQGKSDHEGCGYIPKVEKLEKTT